MKIQLSFDDYCLENIKLAELLMKHEFHTKTIFFIECDKPIKQEQIKKLHDWGFEIGSHTITHPPDIKLLPPELLRYEVQKSKVILEELLGNTINWFCYPKGKFNEKVIYHVKQARYKYARTVEVNKWISPNPYRQNPTIHIYPRTEYDDIWYKHASKILVQIKDIDDATFHLWGHAWEIEKFGYWRTLEDFLIKLKQYENISSES